MPRNRSTRTAPVRSQAAKSPAARPHAVRAAAAAAIEPLEGRRMLTTLSGGQSFDYLAGDGETVVRIRLTGNITAEFLALSVNPDTNQPTVDNLVAAPPPDAEDDVEGADLFNIYISSSDETGSIYIAEIPERGRPDREALPFTGDTGQIRVNDNTTGQSIVTTIADTGTVWIGARTVDIEAIDGEEVAFIPFLFAPTGVPNNIATARPNRNEPIVAGIETARGVGMGNLFVGGVVTGRVFVDGNLGEFYAGSLLTGVAQGLVGSDPIPPQVTQLQNNFFVSGNLPAFTVKETVGTNTIGPDGSTSFRTGVDMKVGGKVGSSYVGGDYLAGLEVVNNPDVPPITASVAEIESNGVVGSVFFQGGLVGLDVVQNGNRTTPQYLPSISSDALDETRVLEVTGAINPRVGDAIDNYALPLIAGQRVQITLTSLNPMSPVQIGLFDPDGRLVRTDVSDLGDAFNQTFEYIALTPGTFVLSVAQAGDNGFDGASPPAGGSPYLLQVENYGEVAVGGVHVLGSAGLFETDAAVLVRNGDIGVLQADATLFGGGQAVTSRTGNLRTGQGGSIIGLDLSIPRGDVGRLATTDILGNFDLNPNAVDGDEPVLGARIGGDYQLISAANDFVGNVVAGGAIGTIRVQGSYGLFGGQPAFPGVLRANADDSGDDGLIDLIDVGENMGNFPNGGPAISTGVGGNVRYISVEGQVFRDAFFGGGATEEVTPAAGFPVLITDDSGADVVIRPNTVRQVGTGGAVTTTTGQIGVTTYGIRSGGSVITRINATAGVTLASSGDDGSVEVGQIITTGTSTEVLYNQTTNVVGFNNTVVAGRANVPPARAEREQNVLLGGDQRIDVFSIIAPIVTGNVNLGNLSNVTNTSGGEIVNIRARSIGYVTADKLGSASSSTQAAVIPLANSERFLGGGFPFNDQRTGLLVGDFIEAASGNIIRVTGTEGVGNIFANNTIGTVIANSDDKNIKGVYDGIYAPILANRINLVDIGEGILPAQSGDRAEAGLFAQYVRVPNAIVNRTAGVVGNVIGRNGADIRGTIAATRQINSITLEGGGSIIDATIGQFGSLSSSSDLIGPDVTADAATSNQSSILVNNAQLPTTDTLTSPKYEVGPIRLTGGGGIIGSLINGTDVAAIDISGGFGFFDSVVNTSGSDAFGGLTTDGLGIRGSAISGGAQTGNITARGTTGRLLDVTGYSRSVRQSTFGEFDRFTGRRIDLANDLHAYLGTSDRVKKVSGVTNEGILEDTTITGSRGINKIEAYTIRASSLRNPPSSSTFPMRISFANDITSIRAYGNVEGLGVTSGGIEDMNINGNVSHTSLNIAGRIASVVVGRSVKGTSSFTAGGPNGEFQKLYVGRSMYGNVAAAIGIGSVVVGRELGSASFRSFGGINSLSVGTDVVTGAYVRANRNIKTLAIGDDIQEGSTVRARSITNQSIKGTVFGDLVIS